MNLAKALLELGRGVVHPFAQTGTALAYTPKAMYRITQNKPIDDIQRRVFGTNDQGAIARNIIGNTAQVGLSLALPAAKGMTALQGAKYGAQVGAAGGVASGFADTGEAKDMLTRGATGGALGGLIGGATPLGRSLWLSRQASPKVPTVRARPDEIAALKGTLDAHYDLTPGGPPTNRELNLLARDTRTAAQRLGIPLNNGNGNNQDIIREFLDTVGTNKQPSYTVPNGFNTPEVRNRMMKDYIEGRPPIKGSSLSGEGARAPQKLSPADRNRLLNLMRRK